MTSLIINSTILPPTDNEIANEEHEDYEYHHVTHPPVVSSLAHVFNPFHAASEKTSGRIKFLILQSGIETERWNGNGTHHCAQESVLSSHLISNINRELCEHHMTIILLI